MQHYDQANSSQEINKILVQHNDIHKINNETIQTKSRTIETKSRTIENLKE
ncbi:hypothetical protein ES702_03394 [subsurface metagenome]